jgi:hypothetical protein
MRMMLESLLSDKYTLLFIPCEVRSDRALLQRYLEQYWTKLGVRSFQHPGLQCKESTYRRCYGCDEWIEVEYSRGIEENNKDESYSGWCDKCDQSIQWEPNYDDDYENTFRVKRGNALIVGLLLNNMQRKKHVHHTEVSTEEIALCEEWLGKCEYYKLSLAPKAREIVEEGGEVRKFEYEYLPFMSEKHISNLSKLLEWVCKQVVFQ